MASMTLYGWSMRQFAIAGGYFAMCQGYLPLPGVTGALEVFYFWVERRNDFPSELHLVELPFGVDRPAETAWATRTFYESAREIGLQKNARDVYRRGPCTTASS